MIEAEFSAECDAGEESIRPSLLQTFIGHQDLKQNLRVFIAAARQRSQSLDHILLSGPPGLGKTTLAAIIANEMGSLLRSTSGPVIEKQGDLAAILTNLEPHQVLFIDEIHRMSRSIEEVLYSAMEDFTLDLLIGQGPGARTVKVDLPPFTLVGATTRAGLLSSPLRDRFGISQRLEFYSTAELSEIIARSAAILECEITHEACAILGARSRGTPRIANRLLRRARDFSQAANTAQIITAEVALETLAKLEVDEFGLDKLDRSLIVALYSTYANRPVGLSTLAAGLAEDKNTIEEVCEPFLLQQGLLQRTARGRLLTDKGGDYAKRLLTSNHPEHSRR